MSFRAEIEALERATGRSVPEPVLRAVQEARRCVRLIPRALRGESWAVEAADHLDTAEGALRSGAAEQATTFAALACELVRTQEFSGIPTRHLRAAGTPVARNASSRAQRWARTSEVQTLLFPRDRWTEHEAKAWARKHGFKYGDLDNPAYTGGAGEYLRLRQADPSEFTALRTIDFGDPRRVGIKAVVGPRRS